ncbi:CD48 antigen-like [Leptodactylus fuscus]|uniref:CD48 antigen-like n=1 Tax=Leptodactylus fuscus TaxID=238119 RepID=UPI003F4E63AF
MSCLWWILLGIYLKCTLCDGSCGHKSHVVGAEGSDVILQVDPHGVVGDITWFTSGNHFATSESGKDLKIRDNRYQGKVYSMEDGSLLLRNLSEKDQGTYIASTLKSTSRKEELCALIYDLRVYEVIQEENIQIDYEVSRTETCNITLSCTGRGSDVTITWESSIGNDINVSSSVVQVQSPDPKAIYTCTVRNPVTSASKSVTPWEYCKEGKQWKLEDYTVLNIIRLKLSACVLIILFLIFCHHMITEVMESSEDNW